jgi:hypothetical protein
VAEALAPWRWETKKAHRAATFSAQARRMQRVIAQQEELARVERGTIDQAREFYQKKLREDFGPQRIEDGLRKEAEDKQRNAFFMALDWLDRPAQTFRSVADELIWGGQDDIWGSIVAGATGNGPKSFADVLKKNGYADTSLGLPGPFKNISMVDIVGMGVDIGADVLSFKGLGAAAKFAAIGKVPGIPFTPRTLSGGLRPEKLPGGIAGMRKAPLPDPGGLAGLAKSRLGVDLPESAHRAIWTGEGAKPLALVTRDMAEKIPWAGRGLKGLRESAGEYFIPFYSLAKAGREMSWLSKAPAHGKSGKVISLEEAAGPLKEMKRFQQVAEHAADLDLKKANQLGKGFEKLSPEEKESFARFMLNERNLPDSATKEYADKRRQFLAAGAAETKAAQKQREPWLDLVEEQLLKDADKVGLEHVSEQFVKTLRWYLGEWEPASRAMGEKLGLNSYLDLYMRQTFKKPGEDIPGLLEGLVGEGSKKQSASLNFLRRRKKPFEVNDYLAEGGLLDPELIMRFDRQERHVGVLFHNAIDELGMRWGYKIPKPKRGLTVPYPKEKPFHPRAFGVDIEDQRVRGAGARGPYRAEDLGKSLDAIEGAAEPWVLVRSRGWKTEVVTKANAAKWLNESRKHENIYAVPAPLGEAMTKLFEPMHAGNFARMFDAAQSLWKASVTSVFPAFHTRNMMGNLWNSYLLDGFDARDLHTAWGWKAGKAKTVVGQVDVVDSLGAKKFDDAGEVLKETRTLDFDKDIIPEMIKNGAWNTGRYSLAELRNLAISGGRPKGGAAARWESFADTVLTGGSPWLNWVKAGRTAGEHIENTSKLAHVLTRMRKGDSLTDAIRGSNGANKAMFVYDLQTPSMHQFSRVFPFARWFTQNVPYQFERLLSKPARISSIQRFQTLLTKRDFTDSEIALLPSYMFEQTAGMWSEDKEKGTLEVLQASGLPTEDLNLLFTRDLGETVRNTLAMASPFLRAFIEGPMDKSVFTGDEISDPAYSNYYRRWNSIFDRLPGPAADRIKSWLDYREREIPDGRGGMKTVPYVGNAMGMYFLTSALGRGLSTAGRISRSLDEEVSWAQELLNLTTGIKVSTRDLATPIGRASITTDRAYELHGEDWDDAAARFESWVDGNPGSMDDPTYTGEEYTKRREVILTDLFAELEANRQANLAQEYHINPNDPKGVKKKRALLNYARSNFLGDELLAIEVYYSLDPGDDEFAGDRGQPVMAEFFRGRDEALERIRDVAGEETYQNVKEGHFLKKMPERVQRVEKRRKEAMDRVRPYWDMPSREGVDLETDERMKFVQGQIAAYQMAHRGLPNATSMARRDYVRATGDARGLAEYREWLRLPWNKERQDFARKHATDLQEWHSKLVRFGQAEFVAARAAGFGLNV